MLEPVFQIFPGKLLSQQIVYVLVAKLFSVTHSMTD